MVAQYRLYRDGVERLVLGFEQGAQPPHSRHGAGLPRGGRGVGFREIESFVRGEPAFVPRVFFERLAAFVGLYYRVAVAYRVWLFYALGGPHAPRGLEQPYFLPVGYEEGVFVPFVVEPARVGVLPVFFEQRRYDLHRLARGRAAFEAEAQQVHAEQLVFAAALSGFTSLRLVAYHHAFFVDAHLVAPYPVGLGAEDAVGLFRLRHGDVCALHGFAARVLRAVGPGQSLRLAYRAVAVFSHQIAAEEVRLRRKRECVA